jgi:hypothetical protein
MPSAADTVSAGQAAAARAPAKSFLSVSLVIFLSLVCWFSRIAAWMFFVTLNEITLCLLKFYWRGISFE